MNTIVVDTREKNPYSFNFFTVGSEFDVVTKKLDYGDYSLSGLEDKVAIERKASTAELSMNFGTDKKRFYREIEVLSSFDHAVFLCEFPEEFLHTFPANSGIPKPKLKYLRMNAKYLRKCVHELEDKYGLEVVFCEDAMAAEQWVFNFLKEKATSYGI